MQGECTICNKAFHKNSKRMVGRLTDPLHIAVAKTCVLKLLIKYIDGDMTVDGFIPVDNTPIEQYYSTIELYLSQVQISTARWNFICGLAELRHQAGKLRALATNGNATTKVLCQKFGIEADYDWLITLMTSIGVPLDQKAQNTIKKRNIYRDKTMKKQASEEGKEKRKMQKMRNRTTDKFNKTRKAADAKSDSTAAFAKIMKADIAETMGDREYGDEEDPLIALMTMISIQIAAPTGAKSLTKLQEQIKKSKEKKRWKKRKRTLTKKN